MIANVSKEKNGNRGDIDMPGIKALKL